MASGDHSSLIAAVAKYGDACRGGDPQLWAEVLQHFVEQPGSVCEPQVCVCVCVCVCMCTCVVFVRAHTCVHACVRKIVL